MVTSSPRPDARVAAVGGRGATVNPHTVRTGNGDNGMTYMQFEFAKVETTATGPWRGRRPTAP